MAVIPPDIYAYKVVVSIDFEYREDPVVISGNLITRYLSPALADMDFADGYHYQPRARHVDALLCRTRLG